MVDVDMGVDVDVGVGVDWFFVCLLFMDEFSIFTLTPQKQLGLHHVTDMKLLFRSSQPIAS